MIYDRVLRNRAFQLNDDGIRLTLAALNDQNYAHASIARHAF